jgi:hypothetical protein
VVDQQRNITPQNFSQGEMIKNFKNFLSESKSIVKDSDIDQICKDKNDQNTVLGVYFAKNLSLNLDNYLNLPQDYQKSYEYMKNSPPSEVEFAFLVNTYQGHYHKWALEAKNLTNIAYSYEWVIKIAKQLDSFIKYMKIKYMIDRPDFKKLNLNNPAFPSGHTIDAFVIASVLSKLHPEHRGEFFSLADRIAKSRVVLGVHFFSDLEAGKKCAEFIIDNELLNINN